MKRCFVILASRVSDLEDCPDMLRISLTYVLTKLAVTFALSKNVGKAVMLQLLIEIGGLQIDLSWLGGDPNDVSAGVTSLDLHHRSLVHVAPVD